MLVKIVEVVDDYIRFDNGCMLTSHHDSDCCEAHWLAFEYVNFEEVKELIFNISNWDFVEKVEDYGIKLLPTNGHPVPIPGYGSNNGYYSSELTLLLDMGRSNIIKLDITDCQVIS